MASDQSTSNGCETVKNANPCPTSDPRNWPLFKNVDDELLKKMKLFYVFGKQGASALFTTNNDKVYGVGHNEFGVLGIGSDQQCTTVPKCLVKLDGKCVTKFASGDSHVLALTDDGKVYAWGNGCKGQLGSGTTQHLNNANQVGGSLSRKSVIDIACGSEHSAAVTECGELYVWGLNYKDTVGLTDIVLEPKLVTFNYRVPVTVKSIVCGASSTHVIDSDADVDSLGLNAFRQLGFVSSISCNAPIFSRMPRECCVTQIASGASHCLALTKDGVVYSWGKSNEGQLGRTDTVRYGMGDPAKVIGIGKVVEVAAIHGVELSVARTQDSQIYVWGLGVESPKLTTFKSIQEAFSHYTMPSITYRTMVANNAPTNGIAVSLETSFNDEETSDVKFHVDGKFIHAHRTVLRIGCEYFRSMFQHSCKESSEGLIEIKDFSHGVYHAFLKYLYTNEIETVSAGELVSLMELAHSILETGLRNRCEQLIKRATTVGNVTTVYQAAIKLESTELETFSIHFAASELQAVMKSEAFRSLADDQLRKFMSAAVEINSI